MIPGQVNSDTLHSAVIALWPHCKFTPELASITWESKLSRYDFLDIRTALQRHRTEDLDATKPSWKRVCQLLLSDHRDGEKNPLEQFLHDWRRGAAKTTGNKAELDHLSDEEVFDHSLRCRVNRAVCSDEYQAKRCRWIADEMAEDMVAGRFEVPAWLMELGSPVTMETGQ